MAELSEAKPDVADGALPLGPQSLVWRYFGDNRMFLIGHHPGRQVRDFHHDIKGQMPDGNRYHALDPHTYF
jgi:uncharacterized protein (DUF2236 family)